MIYVRNYFVIWVGRVTEKTENHRMENRYICTNKTGLTWWISIMTGKYYKLITQLLHNSFCKIVRAQWSGSLEWNHPRVAQNKFSPKKIIQKVGIKVNYEIQRIWWKSFFSRKTFKTWYAYTQDRTWFWNILLVTKLSTILSEIFENNVQ